MKDKTANPVKVPLYEASRILAELCTRLDNGDDELLSVIEIFNDAKLSVAEAIDRRKAVAVALKSYIAAGVQAKQDLTRQIDKLARALQALKDSTKVIIEMRPDIPYRDSFGSKLSVAKNGTAALITTVDPRTKSISNVVDADKVPVEYLNVVSYFQLNTEKVRADLEAGVELTWARLEQGTQLRGL